MKKYVQTIFVVILSITIFIKCGEQKKDEATEMMQKKIDQFAVTELKYDDSILTENEKVVVQKLYEAGKIIDEIFLEQVYSKNFELRETLQKSTDSKDKLTLDLFNIMFGPFDRLDRDKPFYGTATKPASANFYPEDMTKEEFENWIKNHPEDEKAFTSNFTVIKRDGDKLVAVPYSEAYKDKLEKAAQLLKEAATYADNPSLKKYLESRADAFASNDYYQSDKDWMDLKDHTIEIVVGPYEVYEDGMFNYKASFEMFLTILDPVESKKLDKFASYLNDMEKYLPIPDEHKNFNRGSESPIAVVNEIFVGGDSKSGAQTLAFNLPNDERVRAEKGAKKVMVKNMHEAKFAKLLMPISEIVLDAEQIQYVTFDGFFNHTLMHEMTHSIGPGFIKVNGRDTEVSKELKETSGTIEECKADLLGMLENILMIEKGVYPESFENEMWVTFLGGTFRSVRFGVNEAHGGGNAIIYNYFLEKGAYEYNEQTQKVKVNFEKILPALKELSNKLLMIQATGDYEGAKKIISDYAVASPSIKTLVDKLANLPVDIKPIYEIEMKK